MNRLQASLSQNQASSASAGAGMDVEMVGKRTHSANNVSAMILLSATGVKAPLLVQSHRAETIFPLRREGDAKVLVAVGAGWIDLDGGPAASFAFVKPADLIVGVTEIVMDEIPGVVADGFHGHRLTVKPNCRREIVALFHRLPERQHTAGLHFQV